MLIRSKAELLPGADIVKKLDLEVNSGGDRFKVGQIARGVTTFSEKHRRVMPLSPDARAYAKLNEYFGKFRGARIEVLRVQRYFGGDLSVQEVARTKQQRMQGKMGSSKRRFQKWKKWLAIRF